MKIFSLLLPFFVLLSCTSQKPEASENEVSDNAAEADRSPAGNPSLPYVRSQGYERGNRLPPAVTVPPPAAPAANPSTPAAHSGETKNAKNGKNPPKKEEKVACTLRLDTVPISVRENANAKEKSMSVNDVLTRNQQYGSFTGDPEFDKSILAPYFGPKSSYQPGSEIFDSSRNSVAFCRALQFINGYSSASCGPKVWQDYNLDAKFAGVIASMIAVKENPECVRQIRSSAERYMCPDANAAQAQATQNIKNNPVYPSQPGQTAQQNKANQAAQAAQLKAAQDQQKQYSQSCLAQVKELDNVPFIAAAELVRDHKLDDKFEELEKNRSDWRAELDKLDQTVAKKEHANERTYNDVQRKLTFEYDQMKNELKRFPHCLTTVSFAYYVTDPKDSEGARSIASIKDNGVNEVAQSKKIKDACEASLNKRIEELKDDLERTREKTLKFKTDPEPDSVEAKFQAKVNLELKDNQDALQPLEAHLAMLNAPAETSSITAHMETIEKYYKNKKDLLKTNYAKEEQQQKKVLLDKMSESDARYLTYCYFGGCQFTDFYRSSDSGNSSDKR